MTRGFSSRLYLVVSMVVLKRLVIVKHHENFFLQPFLLLSSDIFLLDKVLNYIGNPSPCFSVLCSRKLGLTLKKAARRQVVRIFLPAKELDKGQRHWHVDIFCKISTIKLY